MFVRVLVPAYLGCPESRAVKWSLLLEKGEDSPTLDANIGDGADYRLHVSM